MELVQIGPGEVITRQVQRGDYLYVVREGIVNVYVRDNDDYDDNGNDGDNSVGNSPHLDLLHRRDSNI